MANTALRAESALENPHNDGDALLLEAIRRWKEAVITYTRHPGDGEDPEYHALLYAADVIAREIASIPASGLAGLAVKGYIALHVEWGGTNRNPFEISFRFAADQVARGNLGFLIDALRLAPSVAEILDIKPLQ